MEALGRHLIVEFYNCSPEKIDDVIGIEKSMVTAAKKAGATVINSTFHHFSPFGVSGVVVIEESHLSIHTWPEYRFASIDLFTCGDEIDPWVSFDYLKEEFAAEYFSTMELQRGQLHHLKKIEVKAPLSRGLQDKKVKYNRNIWFTERDDNVALSLRHTGDRLFSKQTPYQKVEILDTYAYGKVLTLDGMIMTTEKDEYAYHEMIAHVPLLTHPTPEKVLIIGGGDGGAAREVLRHENVKSVDLVEIDEVVIEASRKYLPTIASAFGNPRLNVHIKDGIEYVKQLRDETYDVVIIDSTDPVGPAEGLFKPDFYREVYRSLKPDGIMVTQSESPTFNPPVFQEIYRTYREIFGLNNVYCYLAFIPTYPSGMWSFSYCSKGSVHPLNDLDDEKAARFTNSHPLKYYHPDMHRAAFVLPTFVKELLKYEPKKTEVVA
ncbi:MAG: spermidine synthase [Thermoplasmata archaeon]|nr:MAG: spermidine synthase [Thermoplasmata archaeon]HEC89960.1 polyamine aminopropyltransferase [Thermoplasmatales archaeon]